MTHCDRILGVLSDHKPHTHSELYALGTVAHSRISDLRARGHVIEQWRDGDLYLYRLAPLCAPAEDASLEVSPPAGAQSGPRLTAQNGGDPREEETHPLSDHAPGPLPPSGPEPSAATPSTGTHVAQPATSEAASGPEQLALIDTREAPAWA